MFEFAEITENMTAVEILNYYRNCYYAEPQVTERGIVANAINDVLPNMVEVVRCKDCKKWLKCEPSGTKSRVCNDTTKIRLPYDFCSYGERKDND